LWAATFPLLAAVGWKFHIEWLKQIHPSLPVMQPNTAFGLLMASVAVFLLGDNRRSRHSSAIAYLLAAAISFLVLLTLGEYLFGWDTPYPGRPSPQTSANFAVLGAGLLIYNRRSSPIRLGQICALAVGCNAIVAMTGYVFSTSQFHGFPALSREVGMAVHTA